MKRFTYVRTWKGSTLVEDPEGNLCRVQEAQREFGVGAQMAVVSVVVNEVSRRVCVCRNHSEVDSLCTKLIHELSTWLCANLPANPITAGALPTFHALGLIDVGWRPTCKLVFNVEYLPTYRPEA